MDYDTSAIKELQTLLDSVRVDKAAIMVALSRTLWTDSDWEYFTRAKYCHENTRRLLLVTAGEEVLSWTTRLRLLHMFLTHERGVAFASMTNTLAIDRVILRLMLQFYENPQWDKADQFYSVIQYLRSGPLVNEMTDQTSTARRNFARLSAIFNIRGRGFDSIDKPRYDAYVYTIALQDGLFALKDHESGPTQRFFRIAQRLPIELLMRLTTNANVPARLFNIAFVTYMR